MAEIVNLNQYRKKQARHAAEKRAADNRVRFGRSKAERRKARGEADKTTKELDGKHLD